MMILLDFIVRAILTITLIYAVKTTIKDIKNGELKNFFKDEEE